MSQTMDDQPSLWPHSSGQDRKSHKGAGMEGEQGCSRTLPQLPATGAWGFPEPKVVSLYLIILWGFFSSVQQNKLSKP